MVNDRFGIKLLYPSNKTNFQYAAFPNRIIGFKEYMMTHVVSRGIFFISTLPSWNDSDRIYSIEYIETNEQVNNNWDPINITDNNNLTLFQPKDNPVDADLQVYANSFSYDPNHLSGGIAVDPMCDQNHQDSHEKGFSRTAKEFRNVEITSYFQVDEIDDSDCYLFLEARSNNNHPDWDAQCCSAHAYGVRLYAATGSQYKGKIAFYKRTFSGGQKVLPKQDQSTSVIDTFYQKTFGVKFVIYNPDPETNEKVHLEVWLTNVNWAYPSAEVSNAWTKVAEIEDFVGKGWSPFATECGAENADQPITWAAPFCSIGWRKIRHVRLMYTSFREIDINGSFGEDPIPPPIPGKDPTTPEIPAAEEPVPQEPEPPVDAEPPLTPTTVTRRLTLRREIINSSTCVCDGIKPTIGPPPPDPDGDGDGGGGGGTGILKLLYYAPLSTESYAKLASVSGSSSYYLRFGQAVTQTWSPWIGKIIVRVELTIAEKANPRGGSGGGVYCRIRKKSDDSAARTLDPVATEDQILNAGTVCVFEDLENTYKMQYGDKVLFEYDGGDSNNYIKIFRKRHEPNTGTKIVWRSNNDDPGEYHYDDSYDICARIFYITGQVQGAASSEVDYDVHVLRTHRYDVLGTAAVP